MNNYCRNHYTNHDQPTPPTTQTSKAGGNSVEHQVLWWSQHRGNAQHTFRTWKLSPAAPMVLQPIGYGRVGHRHNTHKQERPETSRFLAAPSIHTPRPRHRPPREAPTRTRPQFDQPTPPNTRGPPQFYIQLYVGLRVSGSEIGFNASGHCRTCVLSNMSFSLSSTVDAFIVVDVSIRL